jgi:hypothetical protein
LVIVGEEFGVWLIGVEHHRSESTRRKVIPVGPEGVDAVDVVDDVLLEV